jgi:hypothetical protein
VISRREQLITALCALLSLLSVAALLAWAYRFGTFRSWFLAVSFPATIMLAAIGVWAARSADHSRLRAAFICGVAGGVLGTVGYDIVRIPFVAAGLRLFAPIDSYGVLMLGADSSSPWTGLAGWSYHFANGIGFGIFYAMVALERRWYWGVLWGLVLETATIITPFATTYSLAGKWGLIAIAYGAHLAYGYPLGKVVEAGRSFAKGALEFSPRVITGILLVVGAGLVLWHRPVVTPSDIREGQRVAEGPSAVVVNGRFKPEWMRLAPGGCATVRNDDDERYVVKTAKGAPALPPGQSTKICFDQPGVLRVPISPKPYSGGFVIVDPALR